MGSNRNERFFRAQRILKAKLSDPEVGRLEEMALAREILEPVDVDHEAYLTTTAHLDYRHKTPYERTEDMMLRYQHWYERKQDRRRGRGRWIAKKYLAMCSDRDFTCFWRARQHADLLGVPYDRYLISVMNRASEHGTEYLPAPNQLYGDELAAYVEKDLAPLRKSDTIELFPRECDPRFYEENFADGSIQRAALDAIEAEIGAAGRTSQPAKLARYMREKRLISEPEARRRLGDALVDAALEERLLNPVRQDQPLDKPNAATVPGCFGYHRSAPSAMCAGCPHVDACIEQDAAVDRVLLDRHGTLDIRGKRVREGNRKRKQRQRDRKRAGMTMTLQEQQRLLREAGNPKAKAKRLKAKERREAKRPSGAMKGAEDGIEAEAVG